jgi:hypothetical protein
MLLQSCSNSLRKNLNNGTIKCIQAAIKILKVKKFFVKIG